MGERPDVVLIVEQVAGDEANGHGSDPAETTPLTSCGRVCQVIRIAEISVRLIGLGSSVKDARRDGSATNPPAWSGVHDGGRRAGR